jgi:hypothetical protein
MNIEGKLNLIGEQGTLPRLEAIASMNLGERSEAANRVILKRTMRKELMDKGLGFEHACLIVDNNLNN